MADTNGWPPYAVEMMRAQEKQAGDIAVIRKSVENTESNVAGLECKKHRDRITNLEIAGARQAIKTGFVATFTGAVGGVLTLLAAWWVRRAS